MKYKLTVRYVSDYLELFTTRVDFDHLMKLLRMGGIESFTVEPARDMQKGGEG